ncbi:MAG: helix-turn-helix domain-containing protein [Ignavibacteria bacterium]|jgi:AraC-like DNA-binding protein
MSFFEILLWLGGIQGLLLSVLLITHKSNQPANRYLGAGIFFLSLELFYFILNMENIIESYQYLMAVMFFLPFIYVPFLCLYLMELTERNLSGGKIFIQFVPLLLSVLFYVFILIVKTVSLTELLNELYFGKIWYVKLLNNIKPLYGVGFIVLFVFKINKHNKKLKRSFSNLDQINLIWFRNLLIALLVIGIILTTQHLFEFFYDGKTILDYLIFISIAIFIYFIGFLGLKQPQIFSQGLNEDIQEIDKYKKSGLTDEAAANYTAQLLKIMEKEKPYLNPNLTLYELSKMLNISPHNLSEIINTRLNQNYYDFVNKYRVEEFKSNLLKEDLKNFKILVIAFESGFKSKSSFNSVFKKITGITPSEYKNRLQNSH